MTGIIIRGGNLDILRNTKHAQTERKDHGKRHQEGDHTQVKERRLRNLDLRLPVSRTVR